MNGLEQFFIGYKPIIIWNKSKFIRSVAKNIDQQAAQVIDLHLMISSTQDETPCY
jgi:hypothetical protein